MLPGARSRSYGRPVLLALAPALCLLGPAAEPPPATDPASATQPPSADAADASAPASAPDDAADASAPASAPDDTADASAPASEASPAPPPPGIPVEGDPTTSPPSSQPGPAPTQPRPGDGSPPGPEPAPEQDEDYELRAPRDLPYAPTPARKSALHRGNEALVRPFRKPVFSAAAAFRFGALVGGGLDVMQPYGFGFGAQIRAHFAPVNRARFGLELHAGHTRWSQSEAFETFEGATISRTSLLGTTDVAAGPSFEVPIGPVFVQIGGSAGMAVSSLRRPQSLDAEQDELDTAINFALRGGLGLGIPIYGGHGLSLSSSFVHVFSPREVAIDPAVAEGDRTRPFGSSIEAAAAYMIWF